MAEPSAQFVVSVLGEANGDSFTVQVGLETIGKVYKSGLAHDLGRWVWSEPPYNVSGSLLAGERRPWGFRHAPGGRLGASVSSVQRGSAVTRAIGAILAASGSWAFS